MRRALVTLLGCSFLSLAGAAHAADPNNTKEAEVRFQEGVRLLRSGDYEHARLAFAQANALVRSTKMLWNQAIAESLSGHYVDSLNHLRAFVRDPKADPNDVKSANTKYIPEAARRVGQIEIEAPDGAIVEVDSKDKVGQTPFLDPIAVAPGHHEIEAHLGATTLTGTADVAGGQTVRVMLGSPSKPEPSASVSAAPAAVPPPPSFAPQPSIDPVGGARDAKAVHRERTSIQQWTAVGLGVAAVGLAIGSGVMFAAASGSSDDVDRYKTSPGCAESPSCRATTHDAVEAHNHQLLAAYLLGGGAVLAAGGAAFVWFALPGKKPDSVQAFSPVVVPGGAALRFTGRF